MNRKLLSCDKRKTIYDMNKIKILFFERIMRNYYNYMPIKWTTWKKWDRFSEEFNLPRLNHVETEITNEPNTSTEIKTVIKKQKLTARWPHRWILSNIEKRANAYPSETLSKTCRRRNTFKLILQGHHHPDGKTRQRHHTQKRKLKVNITDEHTCKNPQQNTTIQNSPSH